VNPVAGSYDQRRWRDETTLAGTLPSPGQVWLEFHDPSLSAAFVAVVDRCAQGNALLRAGLLQALEADGAPRSMLPGAYQAHVGKRIRPDTVNRLLAADVQRASWKIAFANLVSGRFTELVFLAAYGAKAREVGLRLVEETTDRSFLDYRVLPLDDRETFALSINVKNAGVQMASAERFFGLAADDSIPMATYKMFGGSSANIPPLIYVYLVDWTLLERLRKAYWEQGLSEHERRVFQLLANVQGIPRDVEDAFIGATVDARLPLLAAAVGYGSLAGLPFRAVSAARCKQIFYENHQRSPYVFVRRMNTDPNVHISVRDETLQFDVLANQLSTVAQRAHLLTALERTKAFQIPDPPL
jgi:hypothetical protein